MKTCIVAGLSLAIAILLPASAVAVANPDEPAAVVVFPYVAISAAANKDTLIQLTNTSDQAIEARCFYENFTPQCTSGEPDASCMSDPVTCTGLCIPRNTRIPLRVRLTAFQPLAWQASAGLPQLPITDPQNSATGATNLFTRVPALGDALFVGTLRCTAVDDDPLRPSRNNVLLGQATIQQSSGPPAASADAAQYRAIGVKALEAGANRDEYLAFGGPDAEYESCPTTMSLNHFFDGAVLHAGDSTSTTTTTLVLANCAGTPPAPPSNVVQYLVYNEFDQRFTSSRSVFGQFVSPLSHIDTPSSPNSIFSVDVSGTLAAHLRLRGINGGVHAIAIETHVGEGGTVAHSDAINAHASGFRLHGDVLSYRPPRCIGDCDFDGNVSIDEAILGVNIALDDQVAAACPPIDANGDSQVTVDEIVSAIVSAADGCPEPLAPTASETPTPQPTPAPPVDSGPDITYFGLASGDDHPLLIQNVDESGRPVFARPYGQGMTLVVEARPGTSQRTIGTTTYDTTGGLPDLQILVSRPLGDGAVEVCEDDGIAGGVPAVPSLEFSTDAATVAAINDLGCRAYDRAAAPQPNACTRADGEGLGFAFVSPVSTAQFCIPIAKAWKFPVGDTVVAVRIRDQGDNLSAVHEIVVRVEH